MIRRMYTVYDTVGKVYGPPMEARNDEIANRYYLQSLASSPMDEQQRSEMCLCYHYSYDDESGKIEEEMTPPRPVLVACKPAKDMTDVK